MIRATFKNDFKGIIKEFNLIGHANYKESGKDIICSAVSVLAINTINSISEFTNDKLIVDTDEDTGFLSCKFIDEPSKESILLINSLILGLTTIKDSYGKKYLQITTKEV